MMVTYNSSNLTITIKKQGPTNDSDNDQPGPSREAQNWVSLIALVLFGTYCALRQKSPWWTMAILVTQGLVTFLKKKLTSSSLLLLLLLMFYDSKGWILIVKLKGQIAVLVGTIASTGLTIFQVPFKGKWMNWANFVIMCIVFYVHCWIF